MIEQKLSSLRSWVPIPPLTTDLFGVLHSVVVVLHLVPDVTQLLFQLHDFDLLLVGQGGSAVPVQLLLRMRGGRVAFGGGARGAARGGGCHRAAVVASQVEQA